MEATTDASWYRRPCFCIVALPLELFLWPWSSSIPCIFVLCITLVVEGGKSSNLWGAPCHANCMLFPLITTASLLSDSILVPVSNPCMFLGGKFSTVTTLSCCFNTVRREDLLGIAISRNLRIKPFVLFYYSISLVERVVLITREILLFN